LRIIAREWKMSVKVDKAKFDKVLGRMLQTPPEKHKPQKKSENKPSK